VNAARLWAPLLGFACLTQGCDAFVGGGQSIESIHAENERHARERAEAIPPGFVTPGNFAELVAALRTLTNSDSIPFVGERDWEKSLPSRGVAFRVADEIRAKSIADTVTMLVRPNGLSVFEYASGAGLGPFFVVAMPTPDPYEAIEVVGTNGNGAHTTAEIVEWLRQLAAEQPFIVTHIGRGEIGGWFLGPLKDPAGIARRFYDFCPDIVRQGSGSVRNLEVEMRESRFLYCWWD
jgi:hypothetical protein